MDSHSKCTKYYFKLFRVATCSNCSLLITCYVVVMYICAYVLLLYAYTANMLVTKYICVLYDFLTIYTDTEQPSSSVAKRMNTKDENNGKWNYVCS